MSTEEKKPTAPAEEAAEKVAETVTEEPKAEAPKKEKKPKKESKKPAEKDSKEAIKEAVAKAVAEEKEKYLRLAAEYDNFRRRSQKDKEALYGDVKASVLKEFLPVYDNLERALKQETADEAYRKGVEMIMNQFIATMDKLGITEIEALGKSFDPALHNAVMHIEDESFGENEVVEVFQKGFKLGDKVIRFAMVKVAN